MGFFSSLLGGRSENKRTATDKPAIESKIHTTEKKDTQSTNSNPESSQKFLINGLAINSSLNISPVLKENEVHLGLVVDTKSKEISGVTSTNKNGIPLVICTITYKVIGVLNLNLTDKTTRIVRKEMFDDDNISTKNILKCQVTGRIALEDERTPLHYARDKDILFSGEEAEYIASYIHSNHNRKISSIIRSTADSNGSQGRIFIKPTDYRDFKLVKCVAYDGFGRKNPEFDANFRAVGSNIHLYSEDAKYLASLCTSNITYNFNKCFTITVNAKTLDINVGSIGFSGFSRRNDLSMPRLERFNTLFTTDVGMNQVGRFLFLSSENGVYRRGNIVYVSNSASGNINIQDTCLIVFIAELAKVTSIKFPSSVIKLDIQGKKGFRCLQEVYLHEGMSAKFMGSFLACLISTRVGRESNIPDVLSSGSTIDRLIRAGRYEEIWEYCNAPARSEVMTWVLNGISIVTYS